MGHETGAGEHHFATGRVQILQVEHQVNDGQIALRELLLVNGKQHFAVANGFQHLGREIEGSQLDLAQHIFFLQALQSGDGSGRAQCKDTVHSRIGNQGGDDALLRLGGISQINSQDARRDVMLVQGVCEALAAQIEGDVAHFMIDANGLGDARCGHAMSAAIASFIFRLADVSDHTQVLGYITAGVDGKDRNTGIHCASNRFAQGVGIWNRYNQAIRIGSHSRIDELRHFHHVECARSLVFDLDSHVLAASINAILDDRPERIGRLAMHDCDKAVGAHFLSRGRRTFGLGWFICYSIGWFFSGGLHFWRGCGRCRLA